MVVKGRGPRRKLSAPAPTHHAGELSWCCVRVSGGVPGEAPPISYCSRAWVSPHGTLQAKVKPCRKSRRSPKAAHAPPPPAPKVTALRVSDPVRARNSVCVCFRVCLSHVHKSEHVSFCGGLLLAVVCEVLPCTDGSRSLLQNSGCVNRPHMVYSAHDGLWHWFQLAAVGRCIHGLVRGPCSHFCWLHTGSVLVGS